MNNSTSLQIDYRVAALRRFALSITIFVILGHLVLGFEQSWTQHLAGIATAYSVELILEFIDSWVNQTTARFSGGLESMVNFLLPAHIVGLAVPTMLYANDRLMPIVFAVGLAIASKAIVRVPMGNRVRHFLNPTNLGIVIAILVLPEMGIVPPWSFTQNITGIWDWIVPAVIVVSGTLLNAQLTGKIPLIAGWVGGFVIQAGLRRLLFETPLMTSLLPMTGVLFLVITFYMVTDPGTTPRKPLAQVIFGLSVAAVYGLLAVNHIVYGMFLAISIVCALRGLVLYAQVLATEMQNYQFWGQKSSLLNHPTSSAES